MVVTLLKRLIFPLWYMSGHFFFFDAIEAWVGCLHPEREYVDAWVDANTQFLRFFRAGSSFSSALLQSVCSEKSFQMSKWSRKDIDELLQPIQVRVDVVSAVCDRCNKAMNRINLELGTDAPTPWRKTRRHEDM